MKLEFPNFDAKGRENFEEFVDKMIRNRNALCRALRVLGLEEDYRNDKELAYEFLHWCMSNVEDFTLQNLHPSEWVSSGVYPQRPGTRQAVRGCTAEVCMANMIVDHSRTK